MGRSRVHISETAALSGQPVATTAGAVRAMYPHEALPGDVYAAIGCF
jgi:hypothetical protein